MATGTAGSSARNTGQPLVHCIYKAVAYNTSGISGGIKIGTIPAGSIVVGTSVHVTTVFNAQTTNVLTVGTNGTTANDLVASGTIDETSAAIAGWYAPVASTAYGPLSADTDVYVKYTQTGTAATTGKAHVIVNYLPTANATPDGAVGS